jgi:hypothetical protein
MTDFQSAEKVVAALGATPAYSVGNYKQLAKLTQLLERLTKAGPRLAKVVVVALCAAALARLALAIYGYQRAKDAVLTKLRAARSAWLERFGSDIPGNDSFRAKWQNSVHILDVPRRSGHPHPEAAADRTGASRAVDLLGLESGLQVYTVSWSNRDDDESSGSHLWECPRDTLYRPRSDPVPADAIIKMIDVDYYVDMHEWLAYGRPIIAYTFVPMEASYSGKEYSYHIDTENCVNMDVNGSSVWRHQVWDYDRDYVVTRTGWLTWIVSSVDVRKGSGHHRVVCLVPRKKIRFWGWLWWSSYLGRRTYSNGSFIASKYKKEDARWVSVLRPDLATSVEVREDVFDAVKIRMAESKKPTIGDVERYLRKEKYENHAVAAALLFKTIVDGCDARSGAQTASAPDAMKPRNYQTLEPFVTEDGREIGRAVAPPIVVNTDFVPNRSYNNDTASIQGRVTKQVNLVTPPSRYNQWAADFLKELVPEPHLGVPYSIADVIEIQDRPTQRARSEQERAWIGSEPYLTVKAFMKAESYGKVADPRNISTVPTEHTLLLSSYTYSFKADVLLDHEWYGPGKAPREVASRVVDLCSMYERITEGDFTRFDGRVSQWLRTYIERAAYLRWVNPDDRAHLAKLLDNELNASATTKEGVGYSPLYSRLSGSPLTTDANTIINVFVAYAAAREAKLSHEHAWRCLGVYAGDDSLSPIDGCHLEKASKCLGLIFKPEMRRAGTPLTFLGRLFVDPFAGRLGSVQDPDRTWRKLHLSFAPTGVSDQQALGNRAAGFLALDPCAPITSTWCRLVERCNYDMYGNQVIGEITADTPYYAQIYGASETWPQAEYECALEAIEWRTGIPVSELRAYDQALESADDLRAVEGLIHNPENAAPVVAAVVDGDILEPEDSVSNVAATEPIRPRKQKRPATPNERPRTNRAARGAPPQKAAGVRGTPPRRVAPARPAHPARNP